MRARVRACVLGLNHVLMCYFSEPQKGYNYLNVEGVQKRQNMTGQVAQSLEAETVLHRHSVAV